MLFYIKKNQLSLGRKGEQIAEKYLKSKNYKIIHKNYKNSKGKALGEIDLIAKIDSCYVFIEVKTRSQNNEISLNDSINNNKLLKLNRIAQQYLYSKKLLHVNYRFDAILILITSAKKYKIKHYDNIFIDNCN